MTPRDQQLAIGGGLLLAAVGGAYLLERRGVLGAIAITRGSDLRAQHEAYDRASKLMTLVRKWDRYLAFGGDKKLPGTMTGCDESRRFYRRVLDQLAETRSAIRHPRIVRIYQAGQATETLNVAVRQLDGALRMMHALKRVHDTSCPSPLRPIPLSALPPA